MKTIIALGSVIIPSLIVLINCGGGNKEEYSCYDSNNNLFQCCQVESDAGLIQWVPCTNSTTFTSESLSTPSPTPTFTPAQNACFQAEYDLCYTHVSCTYPSYDLNNGNSIAQNCLDEFQYYYNCYNATIVPSACDNDAKQVQCSAVIGDEGVYSLSTGNL